MADAEAVARLSLDNSPYKQGLGEANALMDKFSANIGHGLKDLGKMFAGAFAFEKIIGGFERSISEGAKFADLATRFGISASSIQKLGNAASLSGASVEDVASAMNKLAKNAGSAIGGNQKLQQSFQEIGLSVDDLVKMTPEQLFLKLSEAVHSGSLGSRDFAVAMELAGKNAGVLMQVLRSGPEDIEHVGKSMGVMSDEATESLKKAEDAIKKFNTIATVSFGTVLAAFMDIVAALKENPLHFFDQDALEKDIERMHAAQAAAKKSAMSRTLGGDAEAGTEVLGEGSSRETSASRTQDAIDRATESAYKIGAKFDNNRLDYQRKEADRIAKLQEDRAAQKEADQQAYYRKQGKEQSDYSARQDKQAALYSKTSGEYMDAYMAKNAVENRIAGESLSASREGQLILNAAQKRQANQNRIDNYKFQQEQVQKYVDKMQTRGSGQSAEQFERYSNMTPDQARKAAREDLAKQQAAETNPSMRDQAATTLEGYLKNVDTLLKQLTTYAHVT